MEATGSFDDGEWFPFGNEKWKDPRDEDTPQPPPNQRQRNLRINVKRDPYVRRQRPGPASVDLDTEVPASALNWEEEWYRSEEVYDKADRAIAKQRWEKAKREAIKQEAHQARLMAGRRQRQMEREEEKVSLELWRDVVENAVENRSQLRLTLNDAQGNHAKPPWGVVQSARKAGEKFTFQQVERQRPRRQRKDQSEADNNGFWGRNGFGERNDIVHLDDNVVDPANFSPKGRRQRRAPSEHFAEDGILDQFAPDPAASMKRREKAADYGRVLREQMEEDTRNKAEHKRREDMLAQKEEEAFRHYNPFGRAGAGAPPEKFRELYNNQFAPQPAVKPVHTSKLVRDQAAANMEPQLYQRLFGGNNRERTLDKGMNIRAFFKSSGGANDAKKPAQSEPETFRIGEMGDTQEQEKIQREKDFANALKQQMEEKRRRELAAKKKEEEADKEWEARFGPNGWEYKQNNGKGKNPSPKNQYQGSQPIMVGKVGPGQNRVKIPTQKIVTDMGPEEVPFPSGGGGGRKRGEGREGRGRHQAGGIQQFPMPALKGNAGDNSMLGGFLNFKQQLDQHRQQVMIDHQQETLGLIQDDEYADEDATFGAGGGRGRRRRLIKEEDAPRGRNRRGDGRKRGVVWRDGGESEDSEEGQRRAPAESSDSDDDSRRYKDDNAHQWDVYARRWKLKDETTVALSPMSNKSPTTKAVLKTTGKFVEINEEEDHRDLYEGPSDPELTRAISSNNHIDDDELLLTTSNLPPPEEVEGEEEEENQAGDGSEPGPNSPRAEGLGSRKPSQKKKITDLSQLTADDEFETNETAPVSSAGADAAGTLEQKEDTGSADSKTKDVPGPPPGVPL